MLAIAAEAANLRVIVSVEVHNGSWRLALPQQQRQESIILLKVAIMGLQCWASLIRPVSPADVCLAIYSP